MWSRASCRSSWASSQPPQRPSPRPAREGRPSRWSKSPPSRTGRGRRRSRRARRRPLPRGGPEAPGADHEPAGAVDALPEGRLAEQVTKGRPLRVKFGVDPTSPDIHLGHCVVLTKLRAFQDAGHTVVLIIGDYTARVDAFLQEVMADRGPLDARPEP